MAESMPSLPRSELRRMATMEWSASAEHLIALQAERDRLREALELIAQAVDGDIRLGRMEMVRVAAAALDQTGAP